MSNGKAMIIHLVAGLIRTTFFKMSQYFSKSYESFGGDINLKLICLIMQLKQILKTLQELVRLI